MFVITVLLLTAALPLFNWAVDPFGVFGDRFLEWDSYNMTKNPRAAKIAYITEHHKEFDSYIIGCSSTSSYPTEALNRYFDAKFYNMLMYGADMYDVECESRYILENFECKNLVVNIYIDNAMHYDTEKDPLTYSQHVLTEGGNKFEYYLRYLMADTKYAVDKLKSHSENTYLKESFDAFNPLDGTYDKRTRDIERIADRESYLEAYPYFANYPQGSHTLSEIERTVASVGRIRQMCEQKGVNFVLVSAPVYYDYFNDFDKQQVSEFYTALANVTPFWDFSMSSVSYEMRYFYDETHFRNCVGDMALARMFEDDSIWVPDDFGVLVTKENVTKHIEDIYSAAPADDTQISTKVPVLLYHCISETEDNNAMMVSVKTFDAQMSALREAGYTAISIDELQDYVYSGAPLPDKPVIITFDDGYTDNYTCAFPILKKYNMKATIFAIGSSIGKSTYKDTKHPITPHFGETEMKEMVDSGLISIQSHTYDMHQSSDYESGKARENILKLDGESETAYVEALGADVQALKECIEPVTGEKVDALAYPKGAYDDLAATVLAENGILVTFTTETGGNTVLKGVPQTLYGMHRFAVYENTTPEQLLSMIEG